MGEEWLYCIDDVVFAISILLILFGYGDSLFVDVDGVSCIFVDSEEGYVELCAHVGVLFVVGWVDPFSLWENKSIKMFWFLFGNYVLRIKMRRPSADALLIIS